ncbi:MAG: glycerophosphodiester phosphodiesterase [Aureliella sp.]
MFCQAAKLLYSTFSNGTNVRSVLLSVLTLIVASVTVPANAQLIVAHRGASHDAPENTLAAFELAWKQGADAIEGDFYVTKDQQIVCIHDDTTKRVAPKQTNLAVAKSTLKELQQLDVGSWKHSRYADERIPTLEAVLQTVPEGKQIFVEIKCGAEILPLLQKQLKASGLKPEQLVIICFEKGVVTQARNLMPEYRANWLTSYKQELLSRKWKPSLKDVLSGLESTGATGLGTKGLLDVIDQAFVDSIRKAGFEFHVWTVNDAASARKFANFGAQSITTDRPEFIRDSLK